VSCPFGRAGCWIVAGDRTSEGVFYIAFIHDFSNYAAVVETDWRAIEILEPRSATPTPLGRDGWNIGPSASRPLRNER
jgi:hypothetical protein